MRYYIFLTVRSGLKGFLIKLSQEAKNEMRSFILTSVVHKVSEMQFFTSYVNVLYLASSKIDHGLEVSWLSELREVSVLFINLEPGERLNASGTLNLLQSSFDVVFPSLTKYDGRLFYDNYAKNLSIDLVPLFAFRVS